MTSKKTATRMFMLHYGAEPSPKSISVRGAADGIIWCPIIGIAVETEIGRVLLDTGIGRALLEDEASRTGIYASKEQPWGVGEDPFLTALERVGLRPRDFALAAVSHLHVDHTGGLRHLAQAGVPISVQREELLFARERAGLGEAYYRPDYVDAGIGWRELDGDAELAPGVHALSTPGHTPGHMSYRVDLPETGTWLLAMDAADLAENLNDRVPPGPTADPSDAGRAEASLRRLLGERDRLDARLVPGHDTVFWRAVEHPAGGHR
ncbi:MBL fold metallo-hydrolase [Rubrobacter tropicus]|uniref:MBL fold metallo-hydrolase n=1 Tax=Rubrobacter tropicus TaxID=2653851 RepID=A0A6G8Q690_9ACTN|nr:N-acyl homoserine lactonase family protein [Rubrobacter tropicus]QIN81949.1 MBL fold metallo-hydrolase [Rubrobacter tropicus]